MNNAEETYHVGRIKDDTTLDSTTDTVERNTPEQSQTHNTGENNVRNPVGPGPIHLDPGYLITLPGIIKIVEIVIGIICIGCVGSTAIFTAHGWFLFVSVACLILTTTLLVSYFLGIVDWLNLPWEFMEMLYGAVSGLLYIIASIVLAVDIRMSDLHIVAAVFGFINVICYLFGTFWSFQEWRSAGEAATVH